MDRLHDRIKTHGIGSLTDAERQMLAVHWLFVEGYNGGLHQFFFNDAGQFAEAALNGLQAVGARKTAVSVTVCEGTTFSARWGPVRNPCVSVKRYQLGSSDHCNAVV